MAYGLQVFDSSGNITLDTSDRLMRPVAQYVGTCPANSSVNLSVPGIVNDGTWGFNDVTLFDLNDRRNCKSEITAAGTITVTASRSDVTCDYDIRVYRI